MSSNISLNSRQSIKVLTLMSCETRRRTLSWPKGTNFLRNSLSILWWQSTLMPALLKSHRKTSFIFCSPLLPMGGHHLDGCMLTGWIWIWFDTPTENITGPVNEQDQSQHIREIYGRILAVCRGKGTLKIYCLILLTKDDLKSQRGFSASSAPNM